MLQRFGVDLRGTSGCRSESFHVHIHHQQSSMQQIMCLTCKKTISLRFPASIMDRSNLPAYAPLKLTYRISRSIKDDHNNDDKKDDNNTNNTEFDMCNIAAAWEHYLANIFKKYGSLIKEQDQLVLDWTHLGSDAPSFLFGMLSTLPSKGNDKRCENANDDIDDMKESD